MKPHVLDNWMYRDNLPCLGVTVYDSSGRYNFDVKFLRLPSYSGNRCSETSLHEGRFKNYTEEPQPYGIQIVRKSKSQEENHSWFSEVLEWLATYVEEQWSLDVSVEDVHKVEFDFRFSELSLAVLFRLLFS